MISNTAVVIEISLSVLYNYFDPTKLFSGLQGIKFLDLFQQNQSFFAILQLYSLHFFRFMFTFLG